MNRQRPQNEVGRLTQLAAVLFRILLSGQSLKMHAACGMQHVACVSFGHTLHLSNWQRLRNWIDLLPRIIYYLTFQTSSPFPAHSFSYQTPNAFLISYQKNSNYCLPVKRERGREMCVNSLRNQCFMFFFIFGILLGQVERMGRLDAYRMETGRICFRGYTKKQLVIWNKTQFNDAQ